ncbi:hypothetical protein K432DRAFT_389481 [Lepidopterella palustris CBS 459.81]|uniref:Uncharacterized protein n=1 Tax=Lepidopterella palustris CBS 459.81 TaxID=1314670 RepID=A0A8E2EID3_9PEZI|nr:hypothetical protein K432DRAFT_389481 [Lepidopterella palustris CBS 459.81]
MSVCVRSSILSLAIITNRALHHAHSCVPTAASTILAASTLMVVRGSKRPTMLILEPRARWSPVAELGSGKAVDAVVRHGTGRVLPFDSSMSSMAATVIFKGGRDKLYGACSLLLLHATLLFADGHPRHAALRPPHPQGHHRVDVVQWALLPLALLRCCCCPARPVRRNGFFQRLGRDARHVHIRAGALAAQERKSDDDDDDNDDDDGGRRKLAYLELRKLVTLMVWHFDLLPVTPVLNNSTTTLSIIHKADACYVRLRRRDGARNP